MRLETNAHFFQFIPRMLMSKDRRSHWIHCGGYSTVVSPDRLLVVVADADDKDEDVGPRIKGEGSHDLLPVEAVDLLAV